MKFGSFADLDRTRYGYLRLRRVPAACGIDLTDPAAANRLAAIEQQIDRLRATSTSIWHQAPAPEVLAGSLFAASKHADGPLGELFSPAPSAAAGAYGGDLVGRDGPHAGLMVEGDAVSQAVLPKTRAIDGESLTALMAAFGVRT